MSLGALGGGGGQTAFRMATPRSSMSWGVTTDGKPSIGNLELHLVAFGVGVHVDDGSLCPFLDASLVKVTQGDNDVVFLHFFFPLKNAVSGYPTDYRLGNFLDVTA